MDINLKKWEKLNLLPKVFLGLSIAIIILILTGFLVFKTQPANYNQEDITSEQEIVLPPPRERSEVSIEEAILKRRSVREYKDEALSLKEISQILWSAQGITGKVWGGRTAPSAGATYPLEVYLVVKKVEGLKPGVYHFIPQGHKLKYILKGDVSTNLSLSALGQIWVKRAPVNLVFASVYERTTKRYGKRGVRYVHMEVGHAAQNVYLQAESLNLGTVVVGAFNDEEVKKILKLPENESPLYIMPIGRK